MNCLLSLLMLLPVGSMAQDDGEQQQSSQFTADLRLLTRGEIRNGGMTYDPENPSSDDRSAFVLDRERLVLGYQRDWLDTKLTMQHVGTWGHEGAAGVNVYEAWAMMHAPVLKATDGRSANVFAQMGRLALRYDDERIIGSDDWVMASMTHDALRLGFEGYGHKLHVILAYNQNMRALSQPGSYYVNGSRPYKSMHTVWYHYDVPKVPLGASLLLMNIGMQAGKEDGIDLNEALTEWQLVYGGYLKFAPKHFLVEGSYYRQTGHDEKKAKLDAWMAAVKAEWMPNDIWSLQAGYDYLSGDDYVAVVQKGGLGMPLHDVNKGFNPVYGSHHKFYGAMDFFYLSTYINGFTPGMQNAYFGGSCSPLKNLRLSATYHYLATGTELTDLNRTLGHELEVEASYALAKDIKLSAGYSYMTGTETMERLKRASGDGSLRWAWLSLNITPRIFSAKW
jgi:hypothetical protein